MVCPSTKWREVIWKIYDIKHIILLGSKMFDSTERRREWANYPWPETPDETPNDHIFRMCNLVYDSISLCLIYTTIKPPNSSSIRHVIWKIWLQRMPFRSFHSNECCLWWLTESPDRSILIFGLVFFFFAHARVCVCACLKHSPTINLYYGLYPICRRIRIQ